VVNAPRKKKQTKRERMSGAPNEASLKGGGSRYTRKAIREKKEQPAQLTRSRWRKTAAIPPHPPAEQNLVVTNSGTLPQTAKSNFDPSPKGKLLRKQKRGMGGEKRD